MTTRRDVLLGAGMIAALGTGEWLRPRRELRLLDDTALDSWLPERFAGWRVAAGGDFVLPRAEGSLRDRLYAHSLARLYVGPGGQEAMLLLAYGGTQSDVLQLHRPENCYPAVGYAIETRRPLDVKAGGARLPAVALTASQPGRSEDIVYWTRLGEYFPQSASEQRADRFRTAWDGYVGDGVLVRASTARDPSSPARHGLLEEFLSELVRAIPPRHLPGVVGTHAARLIA